MPTARTIGNSANRTLDDLITVQDDSADLLAEALEDLDDGDNDTHRAHIAIMRAFRNVAGTSGVLGHLRSGNMRQAELRAEQLVMRNRSRARQRGAQP